MRVKGTGIAQLVQRRTVGWTAKESGFGSWQTGTGDHRDSWPTCIWGFFPRRQGGRSVEHLIYCRNLECVELQLLSYIQYSRRRDYVIRQRDNFSIRHGRICKAEAPRCACQLLTDLINIDRSLSFLVHTRRAEEP
jgi:hypothetical protein